MEWMDILQILGGLIAGGASGAGGLAIANRKKAPAGADGQVIDLDAERAKWEKEQEEKEKAREQSKDDIRQVIRAELADALEPNTEAMTRLVTVLEAANASKVDDD